MIPSFSKERCGVKIMPKNFLPILIVIFLIVIGVVFYSLSKPKIGPNEVALIINDGETKRAFAGEVVEGMTISDALVTSARAGNFDFNYENGILKRIGQFEQNGKKWNAYLNGKKIGDSPDKVFIKAKDKIELKFE